MSIQAVNQNPAQITGQSITSNSGSASAAKASGANASSANGSSGSSSTSSTPSYSVKISSAARAMLEESTETSVQTAQEAAKGDVQAQRLLAKETAAKAQ